MKKFLFYLLKKFYSRNPNSRKELYKILYEGTQEYYYEQTPIGNVYSAYTEFLLANETIDLIKLRGNHEQRNMLGIGMRKTFDLTIK